jgi:septum formation protein
MSEAPPIVLASQSPRRSELLGRLGLEFTVEPADIDEGYPEHEMPATYAERLAREKAISVAHGHHDALVIGSDTIVVLDSDVLGKPKDEADAARMLNRLSGREHEVFTAVAAVLGGRVESSVERVSVRFRALDDREIGRTSPPASRSTRRGRTPSRRAAACSSSASRAARATSSACPSPCWPSSWPPRASRCRAFGERHRTATGAGGAGAAAER